MATDPVCKMTVDEQAPAGGKAQFWGKYFYFCSKECRINFRRDPQKYVPDSAEGKGHSMTRPRPTKAGACEKKG